MVHKKTLYLYHLWSLSFPLFITITFFWKADLWKSKISRHYSNSIKDFVAKKQIFCPRFKAGNWFIVKLGRPLPAHSHALHIQRMSEWCAVCDHSPSRFGIVHILVWQQTFNYCFCGCYEYWKWVWIGLTWFCKTGECLCQNLNLNLTTKKNRTILPIN